LGWVLGWGWGGVVCVCVWGGGGGAEASVVLHPGVGDARGKACHDVGVARTLVGPRHPQLVRGLPVGRVRVSGQGQRRGRG
jgi:hypothetical protein